MAQQGYKFLQMSRQTYQSKRNSAVLVVKDDRCYWFVRVPPLFYSKTMRWLDPSNAEFAFEQFFTLKAPLGHGNTALNWVSFQWATNGEFDHSFISDPTSSRTIEVKEGSELVAIFSVTSVYHIPRLYYYIPSFSP